MSSFAYYLSIQWVLSLTLPLWAEFEDGRAVKNSQTNGVIILSGGCLCSFQSAFSQINGKSISFDDQSIRETQRLSVDAALPTATSSSGSFDGATESQSQHSAVSNSELNLHSLSSDSGLQTGKTSEISSDDFNCKMEDEHLSPTDPGNDGQDKVQSASESGGDSSSKSTPIRLSRVGSVKSRVNIFQHIENKPQTSPVKESNRPAPKKCEWIDCCVFHVIIYSNPNVLPVSVNKFEAQLLAATKRREIWNQTKDSTVCDSRKFSWYCLGMDAWLSYNEAFLSLMCPSISVKFLLYTQCKRYDYK